MNEWQKQGGSPPTAYGSMRCVFKGHSWTVSSSVVDDGDNAPTAGLEAAYSLSMPHFSSCGKWGQRCFPHHGPQVRWEKLLERKLWEQCGLCSVRRVSAIIMEQGGEG